MRLVHDFLRRAASDHPDRVAIIFGPTEQRITFGELDRQSSAVAAWLQSHGFGRGDRCAIVMDNCPELITALFGVLKAGGLFTILTPGVKEAKLASIFRDCGASALIASHAPHVAAAASTIKVRLWTEAKEADDAVIGDVIARGGDASECGLVDQDLAAIIYTSGTTGESKGVMLTHRNLVNTTGAIVEYLKNTQPDVVCCVLPMAFSYGLCQALGMACAGYTLLVEKSFAFPMDVMRRIGKHRVTGLPGVPTMFAKLIQMLPIEGVDLGALRYVTNAAAAVPPAHIRRFREALPNVDFFAMYGQTECTRACFLDPSLVEAHPDSVGRAIPNCELYIIGPDGSRLGPGQTGQLIVRGANVMRGYWGRAAATAEKLRDGSIPGEKVLHTGDEFRMDENGLFYYVARQDDIFKCKGEKVAPREVEQAICELHEVSEAAVVGVADPVDGLAVKALVVLREGATLAEVAVRRHCQARLEPFMVPKFIAFVPSLPKTDSGKVMRAALAAFAGGGG